MQKSADILRLLGHAFKQGVPVLKLQIKRKYRAAPVDYFYYAAGAFLYAFGFFYFIESNRISPGGLTGLATVLHLWVPLPTSVLYFVLNVPVLLLGLFKIGGRFMVRTTVVTVFISVFMQVCSSLFTPFSGDRLLSALFGGMLCGLGIATVMLRGATTGGVDILAKLWRQKKPYFSMGRLLLFIDSGVAVLTAVSYRDLQTLLYTAVALFASSRVIDAVLYGGDRGRLLLIVTDYPEKISKQIMQQLQRGVTVLPAVGAYTGKPGHVLLCALREPEVTKATRLVRDIDPGAFTVITVTGGVLGEGFEQKNV